MTNVVRVRVRRIYERPERDDGFRVLVDRRWPRGVSKAKAALDDWCQEVAPSTELRKWYDHDPAKFAEFRRRYRAELEEPERFAALSRLRSMAEDRPLTLLTATKQVEISQATVLTDLLNG